MWLFITLILSASCLQTILKLSIMSRAYRWSVLPAFTLPIFVLQPYATGINLKDFNSIMSNIDTLNTVCAMVIIQEALVLIWGSGLIKKRYMEQKIRFWHYIVLLPSGGFPVACFLAQVYLFNNCPGVEFTHITIYLFTGVALLFGGLCEVMRLLQKDRERLIEKGALLGITQIILAMFLPVVLSGKSSSGSLITFSSGEAAGLMVIMIATFIFGVISYFNIGIKIINRLKALIGLNG